MLTWQPRGGLVADEQVRHQPGLIEAQVVAGQAAQGAHRARCAVAADNVARTRRAACAGVIAQRKCHRVRLLRECCEFRAERNLHARPEYPH